MSDIGQHQQSTLTVPLDAAPATAAGVRANDNAVATKHNNHDNDYSIHILTFANLAAFTAASSRTGALACALDTRLVYVSDGSSWTSLGYRIASTALTAADVTAGTFPSGSFVFQGAVSGITTLTANILAGGAASSKILIGSSNLLVRNSGDSSTIATIDPTSVALGSGIAFSAGGGSTGTISTATSKITLAGATTGQIEVGGGGVFLKGTGSSQVELGEALATGATTGYVGVGSCAGAPTGVPTFTGANMVALQVDRTNRKIYLNIGGTWYSTPALT